MNGTVAQVNAALHVTFEYYKRPDGSSFYAPERDPSIDFSLQVSISGLDNCFLPTPAIGTTPDWDAGAAGGGEWRALNPERTLAPLASASAETSHNSPAKSNNRG